MTIQDIAHSRVCIFMPVEEWVPFLEELEEVCPGIYGDNPATNFKNYTSGDFAGLVIDGDQCDSKNVLGWLDGDPSSRRWAAESGYMVLDLDEIEWRNDTGDIRISDDELFSILGT